MPPSIFLHGPETAILRIGTVFYDPGAYALDTSSTTIITYGLPAIQSALAGTDMAALGPQGTDGMYGPWTIVYKAVDVAGNESPAVLRSVRINATCDTGQAWCPATTSCRHLLLCFDLQGMSEEYTVHVEPYVPLVDTEPPNLRLLLQKGDVEVAQVHPGPQIVESWAIAGASVYTDPGWEAVDTIDGDLGQTVSALGLSTVQAAIAAGKPTAPALPLSVRYAVADAAGNSVSALRLVHVLCMNSTRACTGQDGTSACTVDGVCDFRVPAEPVGALVMVQLIGPEVVYVPQGQPYHKCTPQLPLDIPCDQVGW